MFDSVVIDVVIALAAIFLVFSLVTAGIRELISRVLETRAKELWRTLRKLVDDPILSDLREIRTAAAGLGGDEAVEVLEAVDHAEALLRRQVASGQTGTEWEATIDAALAPVGRIAPQDQALAAAIASSRTRLLVEHATGRPRWHGARRAARRGGARPVAPALPQAPPVPELAAGILNRSRTLTDAVHDHPLVRQLDRTWPGFASRMSVLDRKDFSEAVTDLLRAVGVEEALRSSFAPIAAAIEHYALTDEQKAELWEPVQTALDDVRTALHAATPDREQLTARIDAIPDGIAQKVDAMRNDLPDPAAAFGELAALVSQAQRRLALEEREPIDYVRRGAASLAGASPVGDIVERLGLRVQETVVGAVARMEALRNELGGWYDSRMANLSDWYRRRSRLVAFGIGLLVVLAFNVDAVGLSTELWRNESVRDVVVAIADESSVGLAECAQGEASRQCVDGEVDRILAIGLPIGWDLGTECEGGCDGIGDKVAFALGVNGRGFGGGLAKLLGWVLAAAALAMGASFWFDVLTRATGLRKKNEQD